MSKYRASYSSTASTPARSKSTRKLDLNAETKSCSLPALPPSKYPASNVSNNRSGPTPLIRPRKQSTQQDIFIKVWHAKEKFKSLSFNPFRPAKPASFHTPSASASDWWFWKHKQWRPNSCRQHLATLYSFPADPAKQKEKEDEQHDDDYLEIPAITVKKKEKPRCSACMNYRFDPVTLPCGHNFCRRCLAGLRQPLVSEFSHVISDPRAVVKCPVASCHKGYVRCRQFINGDFRFDKIRPEDKVKDNRYSLSELESDWEQEFRKLGL